MNSFKYIGIPAMLLLVNCSLNAQSKDTLSAKQLIEKGTKGDIILGEKNKKDQLNAAPVLLQSKDTVCNKKDIRSSKKLRRKHSKKN